MKRNKPLIAAAVCLVAALALLFAPEASTRLFSQWFSGQSDPVALTETPLLESTTSLSTHTADKTEPKQDAPPLQQQSLAQHVAAFSAPDKIPATTENNGLRARLAQVADDYAEQIQYPDTSLPIRNQEALSKYLPNKGFETERPIDVANESGPSIHLRTNKQQYFNGETIEASVSLSGLTDQHWIMVQLRLIGQGQELIRSEPMSGNQQASSYLLRLTDVSALPSAEPEMYRVVANINIDGQSYEIGTPVTLVPSVSEVTLVDTARISNEYLEIPVHISTTQPGYHELSANLYSQTSEQPLIHLSAQTELLDSDSVMALKAHVAALKVSGDSGPYWLKDIALQRMPSAPQFITEYGHASQQVYEVNGFDLDRYDDTPYVDEEANERLQFLRQLGDMQ